MNLTDKIDKYLNEAKPKTAIQLPNSKYYLIGFGMDANGNSIVNIFNDDSGKKFTIQINDPMMKNTKKAKSGKIKDITPKELAVISKEITTYITKYGTAKMK